MKWFEWGRNTSRGWRFYGRVYITDILAGRDEEPTPEGCAEVMRILRDHGRAMSFSLIHSRTNPVMPAFLLASCLFELTEKCEITYDDWDLFEL